MNKEPPSNIKVQKAGQAWMNHSSTVLTCPDSDSVPLPSRGCECFRIIEQKQLFCSRLGVYAGYHRANSPFTMLNPSVTMAGDFLLWRLYIRALLASVSSPFDIRSSCNVYLCAPEFNTETHPNSCFKQLQKVRYYQPPSVVEI